MSELAIALDGYLKLRRALGFKLLSQEAMKRKIHSSRNAVATRNDEHFDAR